MNKFSTNFRPLLTCPRCGCRGTEYRIEQRGPHQSCFCEVCDAWIKHLTKDDKYRSMEKDEMVLQKTQHCCAYCGEILGKDFTVDHIEAQANGGSHDVDNLLASCKSCNSRKGKKTLEQFRNYLREQDGGNTKIVFWFEQIADIDNLF